MLAVAAVAATLLPLLDAGLTVNGTLAEITIDWFHFLRHDNLLADQAEGVGEQVQLVKLFPVTKPIFSH